MQRSRARKLAAALPPDLPEYLLEDAAGRIHNPVARAQVLGRYRRRKAANP